MVGKGPAVKGLFPLEKAMKTKKRKCECCEQPRKLNKLGYCKECQKLWEKEFGKR